MEMHEFSQENKENVTNTLICQSSCQNKDNKNEKLIIIYVINMKIKHTLVMKMRTFYVNQMKTKVRSFFQKTIKRNHPSLDTASELMSK